MAQKQIKMVLTIMYLAIFSNCKNKHNTNTITPNAHTSKSVEFKVSCPEGTITDIVYGIDNQTTSINSINNSTWESPNLNINNQSQYLTILANAQSTKNTTLTIQIYIDGILEKKQITSGTVLSNSVQYKF